MTIEEIQKAIGEIKSCADVWVAPNDHALREKAALVLSTRDIKFPRWCA